MTDIKFGEKIKITVRGRGKPAKKKIPAKEKRYGAIRRIEDPQNTKAEPNIIFLDTGMIFAGDLRSRASGFYPDGRGILSYIPRSLTYSASNTLSPEEGIFLFDTSGPAIEQHGVVYRAQCFKQTNVSLPMFSPDEEDRYRKVDAPMPLPHRGVDTLGLQLKLNSRVFPIQESKAYWTTRSSAERRLAAAISGGASAGVIASLEHEVAESSFPNNSNICFTGTSLENQRDAGTVNLWFTSVDSDQRDLWRDFGIFRFKLSRGGYSLAVDSTTGIYFEPFDLSDSTNFKIVKRFNPDGNISTFTDSEEITPEQLRIGGSGQQTKVYLIPQLWHFICTYDIHYVDVWTNVSPPSTHTLVWTDSGHTNEGYMPAFSSPMIRNGWNTPGFANSSVYLNHPSYLWSASSGAFDPGDTSEENYLRLMTMLGSWQKRAAVIDGSPVAPHTPSPGAGFTWNGALLQARSDASTVITQDGAPVGMLVGAVQFADDDDHRYFIYRKTAREAATTIYSGDYDDPAYNNTPTGLLIVNTALRYTTSDTFTQLDDQPGNYSVNKFTWQAGTLCSGEWGAYVLFVNEYPA